MNGLHIFQTGILITLALLAGCRGPRSGTQATLPVPVQAVEAAMQQVSYYDSYPTVVAALDEVEVFPQVAGYVTGIHFTDGQKVRKGQKLYTIDQQQYLGAADQARASLDATRADMVKAVQDSARYASLWAKDAVARQSYDYAVAGARAARMQVAAGEAALRSVQTSLKYSVISSPLEGTIGISQVRLGAAVTPGQTLLNTVSADDPVALDFAVDEKDIVRFSELLHNPTNGQDSTFTLILPGGERYPLPGRLLLMDRAVNAATGTITARALFPNPQGVLKVGMSGRLQVLGSSSAPVLIIPGRAVTQQMGEYFVYVVKQGKAMQKKVVPGRAVGSLQVVQAGIAEGDSVVVEGVQRLHDGVAVQIRADTTKAARP